MQAQAEAETTPAASVIRTTGLRVTARRLAPSVEVSHRVKQRE
jgi:hypothetical protein